MAAKLQNLRPTYFDGLSNAKLAGGKLFFYEAGTTTKLDTYSDSGLTTPNSNPIILGSDGRPSTEIFMATDDYKVVLAPADDTDPPASPIWTEDNYNIPAAATFSGGINESGYTEMLVNAQTGTTYTFLTGDRAKVVTFSNGSAVAVTLPQAGTTGFETGWFSYARNLGTGTVTITPTTSTIDGDPNFTLQTDEGCLIVSDGTNYQIQARYRLNLRDDEVTLAKMASGTAGNLITYDSNGDPAAVATGTAGQILTSNGAGAAPTFQAAPDNWVLIGSTEASTSTSITITGLDGTYDAYALVGSDLIPTNTGDVGWIRVGDSGGIDSGSTDYSYHEQYSQDGGNTYSASNSSGAAQIVMSSSGGVDNASGGGMGFVLYLYRTSGGSVRPIISGTYACLGGGGLTLYGGIILGQRKSSITLDRVQFLFSTGTVTSGRFSVFGIKYT